jgi:hypothetical protein
MGLTLISTVVVPAVPKFKGQPAYDLVDLATAKAELQLTDGSRDTDVKRWITQASAAAAKYCNRVFPVELLQDLVYPDRDPFPQVALGTIAPLQLTRCPIAASPCTAGLGAPAAPVLSSVAGGANPAARYYVRITYVTAGGETAVSAESNLAVAANSLLQVASPAADPQGLATGWNVYVGTVTGQETLQSASPLPLGPAWLEPAGGIVSGGAQTLGPMPSFVSVIENNVPLAEGVDFLVDYDVGELTRLAVNGWPRRWPKVPIVAFYPAGFDLAAATFADAQEATIRLVKLRYFGQSRDPMLRSENVEGVYSAQWWVGTAPGSSGSMPPDIADLLDKYRTPVLG